MVPSAQSRARMKPDPTTVKGVGETRIFRMTCFAFGPGNVYL